MAKINKLTYLLILRIIAIIYLLFLRFSFALTTNEMWIIMGVMTPFTFFCIVKRFTEPIKNKRFNNPASTGFLLLVTFLCMLQFWFMLSIPWGIISTTLVSTLIGAIEFILGITYGRIKKVSIE